MAGYDATHFLRFVRCNTDFLKITSPKKSTSIVVLLLRHACEGGHPTNPIRDFRCRENDAEIYFDNRSTKTVYSQEERSIEEWRGAKRESVLNFGMRLKLCINIFDSLPNGFRRNTQAGGDNFVARAFHHPRHDFIFRRRERSGGRSFSKMPQKFSGDGRRGGSVAGMNHLKVSSISARDAFFAK